MEKNGKPFDFISQVSVNLGQDLETIDLMTAANFFMVFIGIESPQEEVLLRMNKKQNTFQPMINSVRNITRNGLSVIGSFVIGSDGEKRGIARDICRFVEEAAIPIAEINLLHAMPGTRLWTRLEAEGRLLPERSSGGKLQNELNYIPDRPEQEILSEYREIISHLYTPSRFFQRAYKHTLTLRPTRQTLSERSGKPASSAIPKKKLPLPLRTRLKDIRIFISILWMHAVLGPCRRQFVRQLLAIWRKNRSRMHRYLTAVAFFEDYSRIAHYISGGKHPR